MSDQRAEVTADVWPNPITYSAGCRLCAWEAGPFNTQRSAAASAREHVREEHADALK